MGQVRISWMEVWPILLQRTPLWKVAGHSCRLLRARCFQQRHREKKLPKKKSPIPRNPSPSILTLKLLPMRPLLDQLQPATRLREAGEVVMAKVMVTVEKMQLRKRLMKNGGDSALERRKRRKEVIRIRTRVHQSPLAVG